MQSLNNSQTNHCLRSSVSLRCIVILWFCRLTWGVWRDWKPPFQWAAICKPTRQLSYDRHCHRRPLPQCHAWICQDNPPRRRVPRLRQPDLPLYVNRYYACCKNTTSRSTNIFRHTRNKINSIQNLSIKNIKSLSNKYYSRSWKNPVLYRWTIYRRREKKEKQNNRL